LTFLPGGFPPGHLLSYFRLSSLHLSYPKDSGHSGSPANPLLLILLRPESSVPTWSNERIRLKKSSMEWGQNVLIQKYKAGTKLGVRKIWNGD